MIFGVVPRFLCDFLKIKIKFAIEEKRGKWVILRENERLLYTKLIF